MNNDLYRNTNLSNNILSLPFINIKDCSINILSLICFYQFNQHSK